MFTYSLYGRQQPFCRHSTIILRTGVKLGKKVFHKQENVQLQSKSCTLPSTNALVLYFEDKCCPFQACNALMCFSTTCKHLQTNRSSMQTAGGHGNLLQYQAEQSKVVFSAALYTCLRPILTLSATSSNPQQPHTSA